MKRLAFTLLGIGLLNCFLAYSLQYISSQVRQSVSDHHTMLSSFSAMALAVPPWFYAFAVGAVMTAVVGLIRKATDRALVSSVVALLVLDVSALFLMVCGIAVLLFPFYDRVTR